MNIEPLKSFLEYEISPSELAFLLDELLDDYIDLIIELHLKGNERRLHVNTQNFIYILKRLAKVLMEC